jgi:hypothetical protein
MRRAITCMALACMFFQSACSKPAAPAVGEARGKQLAAAVAPEETVDFKIEATNSAIVRPSGPDASPMALPRKAIPVLPSESLVIQSGGVSADRVGSIIRSDRFDGFVSRLAEESNKDPLAQEVAALEKKDIEDFFGDRAYLRNFACGTSVCAGTVAMGRDATIYRQFSDHFMEAGPPNASLLDFPVKLDNGEFEQRFVMSVDPDLKGVRFRAGTHP